MKKLTIKFERIIRTFVERGIYKNRYEVITEALRALVKQQLSTEEKDLENYHKVNDTIINEIIEENEGDLKELEKTKTCGFCTTFCGNDHCVTKQDPVDTFLENSQNDKTLLVSKDEYDKFVNYNKKDQNPIDTFVENSKNNRKKKLDIEKINDLIKKDEVE